MNFPDPNVTTEYESPEGIKYVWNGFAWEIVCGGGTDVSGFVTKTEFETDQDRQDQELEDYKQEVKVDQDRQDQELVDYKQEVKVDQDRQDDELQAEIDARVKRDALHDAQLETIEYKLDALVGLTFRGTYEFKHEANCDADYQVCIEDCLAIDPQDQLCRDTCANTLKNCNAQKVRPGYFEAVDPDDQFDHLEQIVISKSDKSNVEIEWANVLKKDDYLEVDHVLAGQLDKTNYGLYRITEDPEEDTNAYGEEVYTMKLQFLQGDGVMNEGENYEIRGITSAEGVNPEELGDFLTKDQAAATYLPLTGGKMEGSIDMKGASGRNKILNLATPTSDYHAANRIYVDNKIEGLLAKIEELDMAGGIPEIYQLKLLSKSATTSGNIGDGIGSSQILSCNQRAFDNWSGNSTSGFNLDNRHMFICLSDGYQLNSGFMTIGGYDSSDRYTRADYSATCCLSEVERCPPQYASGKNIYRAIVQFTGWKKNDSSAYPSWSNGAQVYVTFTGGSLTKKA